MAHLAKYKAPSCGHMLAHYKRSREAVLERDNIDRTRTELNYVITRNTKNGEIVVIKGTGKGATWATIEKRMERAAEATGRALRKDAVVMADMVITRPQNVPEADTRRFFELCYKFMGDKVGKANLMGGYVHMDETTPHMHIPFTPITKDGRFSFAKVCPRSFYQRFHKEIGDYLEKELGYRPEIELTEERKHEKVLSSVPQEKLDIAKEALVEQTKAELEKLQNEVEQTRAKAAEEQERLERLRQTGNRVAERVGKLESIVADVRGFESAPRSGKRDILEKIADKCKNFADEIRARAEEVRLGLVLTKIELQEKLHPRVGWQRIQQNQPLNQRASLSRDLSAAREAARAYNRDYGHSAPNRGRSR
jgi:hypothetical protein